MSTLILEAILVKVTRFINGKKINKIDREFLIRQSIVADTIETVNDRLKLNQNTLKDQPNE